MSATYGEMGELESAEDAVLLALTRDEPRAFAVFYARHERRVLRFVLARTRDPELAADLCAEVFAEALSASRAGTVQARVPLAWLFGIASHKLSNSARAGRVDDRARQRLGMRALELGRGELSEIERLLDEQESITLLAGLSEDQRTAISAYVIDGEPYARIAAQMRCSELVVRKRVSRGLAILRARAEQAS